MSLTASTNSQIKARVITIYKKHQKAKVIGIKSKSRWDENEVIEISKQQFRFFQCDSALQIRDVLSSFKDSMTPVVIITSLEESDLGQDLLARLANKTLHSIRPWKILLELFQARTASPNLLSKPCLAEALLNDLPSQGFPPTTSGVLDEETVWRIILCDQLRFISSRPDARELLEWSLNNNNLILFQRSSVELQTAIQSWVKQSAGGTSDLIFRAIAAGYGADAVPLGLTCDVVFTESEQQGRLRESAIRLERFIGDMPLQRIDAQLWGSAATAIIDKLLNQGDNDRAKALLSRFDYSLEEIGAADYAYLSRYSTSGFILLLNKFGEELQAITKKRPSKLSSSLLSLAEKISNHYQAQFQPERTYRVEMAIRLVRFITIATGKPHNDFEQAACSYYQDGGFIDWARNVLSAGDSLPVLSQAYNRLNKLVTAQREEQNKQFAELLVNWTELGSKGNNVIIIEDLLQKVVAPLASLEPVLLLVLDGMSMSVFRELLEDILAKGWAIYGRENANEPLPVISALPTVTEVSRTSLLCGHLTTGARADEVSGFKSQPDIVRTSSANHPPILFHKGNLTIEGGYELAPEVCKEINLVKRKVVGVVVNAVDDHLTKGSQISISWGLKSLPVLNYLLQAAQNVGRIVVITSDHGHIIERNTIARKSTTGERYRPNNSLLHQDELVVKGSRVLLPKEGEFIASWSETVRYGTKKHGYHGGVTPQECVVPLVILGRVGQVIKGWVPANSYYPEWWSWKPSYSSKFVERIEKPTEAKTGSILSIEKELSDLPLFTQVSQISNSASNSLTFDWIETLLQSPIFNFQIKLLEQSVSEKEMIKKFLSVIKENKNVVPKSTLMREMKLSERSFEDILNAMRRLLNVDGYDVLSVDDTSKIIALNLELLVVQFDLK